jgi:hypothetical protein
MFFKLLSMELSQYSNPVLVGSPELTRVIFLSFFQFFFNLILQNYVDWEF